MPAIILDANAILRYILDDIKEQADQVQELLENSLRVVILPEVMAEVVYVLGKHYEQSRAKISKRLLTFLDNVNDAPQTNLHHALELYGSSNFDFVDCILYSYSKYGAYKVFTFDKKMQKLLEE